MPAHTFYGQPNIHKPGLLIYPNVSCSGSLLCNLNKYIANILKAYVKNESNNTSNSSTFFQLHHKCSHSNLENFFHHINNPHQNIKRTMEEESNGELAFLDIYWNGIMERSLYWYIGRQPILTNTYTTVLTSKQVARKVLFPPCLIAHIPFSQI